MNKEVRKRLEELKKELEELQAIINKPDRWQDRLVQPDKEEYFSLVNYSEGGFCTARGYGSNRKPEHAFKTEEQAELVKEKMLLMQEMYAFAHVKNEGWIPDWGDDGVYKWGITFSGYDGVSADWKFILNEFVFGIAVKSEEIALDMLEEFGERIESVYNKQY